jgi:hypothetical protein
MKGLKAVYGLFTLQIIVLNSDAPTDAVDLALVEGLRKNTKLQKIFEDEDNDRISITLHSFFSPGVAREIESNLGLNRHGRMLLTLSEDSEPLSGLWPRVLAKLSSPRDTSLLFYFLQNKPKIVKCKAVPVASRKRKTSNLLKHTIYYTIIHTVNRCRARLRRSSYRSDACGFLFWKHFCSVDFV